MYRIVLILCAVAAFGLTVYDVQYSETGPSSYDGSVVTVSGVVTAVGHSGDKYFIADAEGGPWRGVYVYDWNHVALGDYVTLEGEVDEYYDFTEIKNVSSLDVDSTGPVPDPYVTNCLTADSSEALEGVLVTVLDAMVVDDTEGEWYIADESGTLKVTDGFDYSYSPSVGDSIESITGTIFYDWGEFSIEPRSDDDIVTGAIDTSDTTTPPDTGDVEYYTIADIQANVSSFMDDTVRIEGIITVGEGLISTSQLKAYVQDTSGAGILLFDYSLSGTSDLVRGNKISVVGVIDEYNGILELVGPQWEVLSSGNPLPDAVDAFSLSSPEDDDGTWMSLGGHVTDVATYSNAANITVSRGGSDLVARVWSSTGIDVSSVSNGDSVVILGAASLYSGDFQLLPGYQSDITVVDDTTAPPDTGITAIADIQNNLSTYSGMDVTVRGVITVAAGATHGTLLQAYIQDESGMGVQLFYYELTAEMESTLVRGAEVQVEGEVDDYNGVTEIIVSDYTVLGTDTLPEALEVTDVWDNATDWEGTWMKVEGPIVESYSTGSDWNVVVDATGSLTNLVTVRIWGTTGIDGDELTEGMNVTIYGVGGIYSDDFQLLPAAPEDIQVAFTLPPDSLTLVVDEGVLATSLSEELNISFTVPSGSKATLRLFDRMGRSVATLFEGTPYSQVSISWDGRDRTDTLVRPGVYMLHLLAVDSSGSKKTARATVAVGSELE